jgi:hypothetical protein
VWFYPHVLGGAKLDLISYFRYKYQSVIPDEPIVDPTDDGVWEWKNVHGRNSWWSPTVAFADGWGQTHSRQGIPVIPGVSVFYIHLWQQMDAWGNCGHSWGADKDPSLDDLVPDLPDVWPF